MFSRSSYPKGLSKMLYDLNGSGNSNMGASKPKVAVSKLVDKIGTKI